MYTTRAGLIPGFHGYDKKIADEVINQKTSLLESSNEFDWLGHGMYFWENSPARAMEFAQFLKDNPSKAQKPIEQPSVIGAIIDLGYCFDLVNYEMLSLLKSGYEVFKDAWEKQGKKLPANKAVGHSGDLLLRNLDCAVIETIHQIRKDRNMQPFDSVRGVFWEGDDLYPNAGFKEKNHLQLCIRNPNCIKGYFYPRELKLEYSKV